MTRIDTRSDSNHTNPPRVYEYRCLIDGEDVSTRCFLADDETGEVGLYRTDETGHYYYDMSVGGPAVEFRKGTVRLIAPE